MAEFQRVASVVEFEQVVFRLHEDWSDKEDLWFRGSSNRSHAILPGLYWRNYKEEWAVAAAFKSEAPAYLGNAGFDHRTFGSLDDWGWYFMMQHYGLPTRLVDWTSSPLVGLYFALQPGPSGRRRTVPCVWAMDPGELNQMSVRDRSIIMPGGAFSRRWCYPDNEDAPGCKRDRAERFTYCGKNYTNRYPIAISPPCNNARMAAQKGVFTLHGSSPEPLDKLLLRRAKTRGPRIRRIDIDPTKTAGVRRDLERLGVTELSIFPELPVLARQLKRSLGIDP